jgi:chemotaxis protein CheX
VSSKKVESGQVYTGDVTGIVGLVQDSLEGNLIVSFGETLMFDVLSKVYGRTFTEIDNIVQEGAGELANMIFGQLKLRLNNRGHNLKMSLPNVIAGKSHRIQSAVSSSNLVALFGYGDQRFEVAVALQKFGRI